MNRLPRFRYSLRTLLICVLLATAFAAGLWHWSRGRPHIVLALNGDALLLDGQPAELDWLEKWGAKLLSLANAETTSATNIGSRPQKRLLLQLNPDLSFGVLQNLLLTAVAHGEFTKFAIRLGGSGPAIEFELPGERAAVPDGTYSVLSLELKPTGTGTPDLTSLRDFAMARKPAFVRILADNRVAIAEVMSAIEVVQKATGQHELWFVSTRQDVASPRGCRPVACSWRIEDVELRCGRVVVPADILEKAEMGDGDRSTGK